jgi:lipid II:glycine glycyltransferase (peptidoglycan interpeptide bridge formation enzyme)
MAPYLMQWQAIQDAKHANVWFYDFWGAAPEGAKGQEAKWSGFSRFKKGFSPELELTEYVGTYEKVYQPVKLGFYRYLQKIYKKK